MVLGKYMQLRAPKYINGKLESPRMRYLLFGVSKSTKNGSKSTKNGDLGLPIHGYHG